MEKRKVTIDAVEFVSDHYTMHVRLKRLPELRWRLRIAMALIRLASVFANVDLVTWEPDDEDENG